jgi:hypothetical protein
MWKVWVLIWQSLSEGESSLVRGGLHAIMIVGEGPIHFAPESSPFEGFLHQQYIGW